MSSTAERGPWAWYAPGVTGHNDATPPEVHNDDASVEEPVESWLADVAAARSSNHSNGLRSCDPSSAR